LSGFAVSFAGLKLLGRIATVDILANGYALTLPKKGQSNFFETEQKE
jgi:hypothetical protein